MDASTQVTDLGHDHACLTFRECEELFDLTAAFVRDGLAGGLKVVWLSDTPPTAAAKELASRGVAVDEATASGQMVVAANQEALLHRQAFDVDHAIDWLTRELA